MRSFYLSLSFTFLVALTGCASTDVTKANIKNDGKSSGVIVNIEGPYTVSQTFDLIRYDPDNIDDEGRVKLKGAFRQLKLNKNTDGYVFTALKPGNYVLKSLTQQLRWTSCFRDDAIAFEAKSNEMAYLGTLRPLKSSLQLQKLAVSKGNLYANNSQSFHYMDNIIKPDLNAPSQGEVIEAKQYLNENASGVELSLTPVSTKTVKFQTGKSLFGSRVCHTGY